MEERLKSLSGIVPFLFALGCARAWVTLVVVLPPSGPLMGVPLHNLFDIFYCLIAAVFIFAARRVAPLSPRVWVAVSAALLMFVASLCSVAISSGLAGPSQLQLALSIVLAVCGGVGFSVFLLLWAETMVHLSLLRIFIYTVASQLAGTVFVFFCRGFDPLRSAVMLLLLPLAASAFLRYAYLRLSPEPPPCRRIDRDTYPWKLFVLFALYSLAYGLREQQLAEGAGVHSSLATAIVMVALLIPMLFCSTRMNMALLYRSPAVLMVCGFLLIPVEAALGTVVSSYLISMSYSLMTVLVALILYDIAKRMGVAILLFVSIKSAEQIFVVWGKDLSALLEQQGVLAGGGDTVVTALVAALVLASTLILFSERELSSKWGVTLLTAGELVEKSEEEERLERAWAFLTERFRLSPREAEVFRLICFGKTGPEIQRELVIAEGTFKAHTRHIYEKMGINSRKELMALVTSTAAAPSEGV